MKLKTVYICQSCNEQSTNWSGKCKFCESWNSLIEEVINIGKTDKISSTARKLSISIPQKLSESFKTEERTKTSIEEFDQVIGGGFVKGSITLLTGEPGIGKSTLTLQIAGKIAKNEKVIIISGEESVTQIAKRSNRLKIKEDKLMAVNEHHIENILETIQTEKASLAIIDSIQVISSLDLPSAAGSINQVRYCTERLMELAKTKNITILLIGHVTKQGNLAGPRVLEHLVDTVIHLEGDRFQNFRILRSAKNRFGSCNEVGLFDMDEEGLKEIKNPSEQLLQDRRENAIGAATTAVNEGNRTLLIEVQALVSTSPFGYPKRTANGFDINRLQILIAVLEKYGRINLQNQDVFINVIGGIKLNDPAADLAVLCAIASSFLKKPLAHDSIIFGEVGLTGEIRKVKMAERRINEAKKMGLTKSITPLEFKEIRQALRAIDKS